MRYSKKTKLYDDKYAYQTGEYRSWANMISRCKPQYKESQFYADKGIKVCERWSSKNAFLNFYKDMGRKPSDKHTIDRIDNSKGYTPDNCRWADKSQQAINRKICNRNTSGYRGVSWYKLTNKWAVTTKKNTIGYFKDIEEAALAYDCAAIQLYGDDAQTNILGVS